jgi:hypothetical protein
MGPSTAAMVWLTALAMAGCAVRTARLPATPEGQSSGTSFIDLETGWRLRVVTPILKSGGYRLSAAGEAGEGGSITLRAGDEFLGYELAYYMVKRRNGIAFQSAVTMRDGKTIPQAAPMVNLFSLPHGVRHVRLIYLVRISQADHDMAVAAAGNMEALEALTRRVQANPADGCRSTRDVFCGWIPGGIAVAPEVRRTSGGAVEWTPAR